MSDDFLDFDLKGLGGFKRAPRSLLSEHGEVYRSHLRIARKLADWANDLEQHPPPAVNQEWLAGRIFDLRDITAHLRQGHFLPGGSLYDG